MQVPAQITITKDGKTLIVVDANANELVFADAPSMSAKYKISPISTYPNTSFTISTNAVLNQDESGGVIASNDGTLFVFKTSTGEILDTVTLGTQPAFTTLTPGGSFWRLWLC